MIIAEFSLQGGFVIMKCMIIGGILFLGNVIFPSEVSGRRVMKSDVPVLAFRITDNEKRVEENREIRQVYEQQNWEQLRWYLQDPEKKASLTEESWLAMMQYFNKQKSKVVS